MSNSEKIVPYQFKVGNPGGPGRPKGSISFKKLFRMVFDEDIDALDKVTGQVTKKAGIELIIRKHLNRALAGDLPSIKEAYDRYEGKVAQTIVKEGNPDAPLETMVTVRNESDQEIYERFKRELLEQELRKNGHGDAINTKE